MIVTFRHKGLKELFLSGKTARIKPEHIRKVRMILFVIDNALAIDDCNFPGSGLHKLQGDLKDYWSVRVSGNWRIIFQFEESDAYELDYVDYH